MTQMPRPPFLLEVRTERFYELLQALERAGFELRTKLQPDRYVLVDDEQQERPCD